MWLEYKVQWKHAECPAQMVLGGWESHWAIEPRGMSQKRILQSKRWRNRERFAKSWVSAQNLHLTAPLINRERRAQLGSDLCCLPVCPRSLSSLILYEMPVRLPSLHLQSTHKSQTVLSLESWGNEAKKHKSGNKKRKICSVSWLTYRIWVPQGPKTKVKVTFILCLWQSLSDKSAYARV